MTRWSASALHLGISLLIGVSFAALTRFVWYPGPLFQVSGAVGLLFILVPVDVVLGPLLTLIAFNPTKTARALRVDLSVIAVLQLAALAYGIWAIAEVRPAYTIFVGDGLRIVRSIDIEPAAPWSTPLLGPEWVAIRSRGAVDAEVGSVVAVLKGRKAPLFDAQNYIPFSEREREFRASLVPLAVLSPGPVSDLVSLRVQEAGLDGAAVSVLPIMVRDEEMTAVIDSDRLTLLAIVPGQVGSKRPPAT